MVYFKSHLCASSPNMVRENERDSWKTICGRIRNRRRLVRVNSFSQLRFLLVAWSMIRLTIFVYRNKRRSSKLVREGVHVCVIRKRHAERLDSEGLANEPRRPHTRPPLISTNCSPINYAHTVELIRRWHYYPVDCRLRYRALRRSATIYGDWYRRISVSRRSSLVSRGWIARSRIGPILLFVSMLFRSLLFRSRVKPLQPNFTLNFLFVVEGSNRWFVSWIRVAFESSLSSSNALEFLVKIIRRKK